MVTPSLLTVSKAKANFFGHWATLWCLKFDFCPVLFAYYEKRERDLRRRWGGLRSTPKSCFLLQDFVKYFLPSSFHLIRNYGQFSSGKKCLGCKSWSVISESTLEATALGSQPYFSLPCFTNFCTVDFSSIFNKRKQERTVVTRFVSLHIWRH